MMNSGTKAAIFIPQSNCFQLRAALFHSTPVLERKRRNFWDCSWKDDFDEDDTSSSRGTSWFRKQYSKGSRRNSTGSQGSRRAGRSFQFCEDEVDVESIFRSAFGGNRYFYWSFINEENPHWRRSSNYSNYYERTWRHRFEHDYDSSPESDSLGSDLASDRLALGLSASGPLKIEDVKNAYRACALKWHPDRHQGSSKAIAEEKFKLCSAAYQSLCDKLAPA
ncbi:uncharacterized protein LOC8267072 isoform X2 [Ricinus communis]|uniref:uncharacterized protein LOC8267072 isoform X2 n=1 Tax=Ricinus communis TaxID=3988 RepID=UPI0007724997|nr:uncharacterized protein LOC8267072 isoform X2 [Ricinus communis]|eukprot:XP_015581810.1 uncharacterized protein LOC8267072 isoform X2 [Ricinus communis]